jgi:uncharacterized protein with NAD-binding domain and iron-sulfur cluster
MDILQMCAPDDNYEYINVRNYMNGPTSERFITPWFEYLKMMDVEFKLSRYVTSININQSTKSISSLVLDNGEIITGDEYVFSLSYIHLERMIEENKILTKYLPPIQNIVQRWANGIQIFLSEIPNGFHIGYTNIKFNSPWSFVCILYGNQNNWWKNVSLPKGTKCILSATYTDEIRTGVVFHKSITQCTKKEIFEETLAQCELFQKDLIIGYSIDWNLQYVPTLGYSPLKYPPHVLGEIVSPNDSLLDQKYLIECSPLSVPYSNTTKATTLTHLNNLYLTGEYVEANFPLATMEYACETGYRSAREIARKNGRDIQIPNNSNYYFHTIRKLLPWDTYEEFKM